MNLFIHYPSWLRPEIIPGLVFRWYGLMYVVAFLIATLFLRYIVSHEKDLQPEATRVDITDYVFWCIVAMLVGGRLAGTLVYDPEGYYRTQPWLIFWPFRHGTFTGLTGMSYHGALIGAVLGAYFYCRIKKLNFLYWVDSATLATPLAYTFGRLGNFINEELIGRVTTVPWGMVFPHAERFPTTEPWVQGVASHVGIDIEGLRMVNLPRHPSPLYEAFFEGIFLWLILWFVVRKRRAFPGIVMGIYLIGYGLVRFIIEYYREPDLGVDFPVQFAPEIARNYLLNTYLNFTMGQVFCFAMIVGGGIYLAMTHQLYKRGKISGSAVIE